MEHMKKSSKRLKTALTVSLLVLASSCGCFPDPPSIAPKQIVERLGVCKQYKATFGKKLTFKYEKDIPIADCLKDGDFVLTDEEIIALRKTYNAARECEDKKTCKLKRP